MSVAPAPPSTRPSGRLEKLRYIRSASKRRVRGREDVAPLAVQHVARRVDDAAHVGADRARRALAGDRPFVIGLGVIVLLAIVVVSGPLQAFLAGHDRLETATEQLAALDRVTSDLDRRANDLSDPEHIEVLARSQLGYAMPGQVAYSLVPPEPADGDEADALEAPTGDQPWWRRLVDAIRR
ncbi:FtsB family cell division protein [Salsipaludibacter albus]|uniref:FtsB family cell division protein n=1 Tax=Salsipaludibacter albus TaxID=2849650 RepID=UPI001EE4E9EE|nr:septum formation initiator family protein [Salsipaludibacter albus]MBY5161896.1 septum formation initiator family protein [Salsipaludibacter albus]